MPPIDIREGNVRDPRIIAVLERHLALMRSISPPESVHALDVDGLTRRELTFWSAWTNDTCVATAALKQMSPSEGEVKSMHTVAEHRGKGLALTMLDHVLSVARARGYRRLWLETGSQPEFAPARALYARRGFVECGPFGSYKHDPHSAFMTLELGH
jgi:putative acetyltransferase